MQRGVVSIVATERPVRDRPLSHRCEPFSWFERPARSLRGRASPVSTVRGRKAAGLEPLPRERFWPSSGATSPHVRPVARLTGLSTATPLGCPNGRRRLRSSETRSPHRRKSARRPADANDCQRSSAASPQVRAIYRGQSTIANYAGRLQPVLGQPSFLGPLAWRPNSYRVTVNRAPRVCESFVRLNFAGRPSTSSPVRPRDFCHAM